MKVRALLVMFAMLGSAMPAFAEHGSATIGGTVTNLQGDPLASFCVDAFGSGSEAYGTMTGEDGSYSFGVTDGEWLVRFWDCTEGEYLDQWYDGKNSWRNADPIPLGPDEQATGIDAVMTKGGSITGTIRLEDEGWADVNVSAQGQDGIWNSTFVDVDGSRTYTIDRLPAGEYTVKFQSEYDSDYDYITEFYDDALEEIDATLVSVVGEQVTDGIDAELAFGGSITGRVMDVDAFPVGVCVDAFKIDSEFRVSGHSLWDGRYEVGGLPTGSYKVQFSDCESGELATEWYDDVSSYEAATEVPVVAPEVTSGIDAELARGSGLDLSIDRVWVTPVPVKTDLASAPGAGLWRTVHALVSNRGNEGDEAFVYASATTVSDHRRRRLGAESTRVMPGETLELTFAWDGTGMIGDAIIKVSTCSERDTQGRNNVGTTRSYVGVGGTGSGYTVRGYYGGPADCWEDW